MNYDNYDPYDPDRELSPKVEEALRQKRDESDAIALERNRTLKRNASCVAAFSGIDGDPETLLKNLVEAASAISLFAKALPLAPILAEDVEKLCAALAPFGKDTGE